MGKEEGKRRRGGVFVCWKGGGGAHFMVGNLVDKRLNLSGTGYPLGTSVNNLHPKRALNSSLWELAFRICSLYILVNEEWTHYIIKLGSLWKRLKHQKKNNSSCWTGNFFYLALSKPEQFHSEVMHAFIFHHSIRKDWTVPKPKAQKQHFTTINKQKNVIGDSWYKG